MLLDALQTLIETLRDRITKHGSALSKSEALTRYALIDPLLRELGWDTTDPEHVLVEVRFGSGSADYALLGTDGKPRVIVEAKRLGTPLKNAVSQGINYSIEEGILYFALTDGQHWELYETHRPVPLSQKLVMKLNLCGSVAETCLNALALWRPSVADGYIKSGAQGSALPPPKIDDGWIPLTELQPKRGSKPSTLQLPPGTVVNTPTWRSLILETAQWLCDSGYLSAETLPIRRSDRLKTYIVAMEPIHGTGRAFSAPRRVGPFFLELSYQGGPWGQTAKTCEIIKRVGQNPADFAVRLAE